MELNGDFLATYHTSLNGRSDDGEESPVLTSNFFLDRFGDVILTLKSDELSWKPADPFSNGHDESNCLGIPLVSKSENAIKFSHVYAVELINWGMVQESSFANAGGCLPGNASEMYRFSVHVAHKLKAPPFNWCPTVFTFGHQSLHKCQTWVDQMNAVLNLEVDRPKSLLVFVHPRSGKGSGCQTWDAVAPLFYRANVKTKVTVTQRAGHAFDVMASITNRELNAYDGVVAVGGDGFFNEILNGLLLSRHRAPYPPAPKDCNANDNFVFRNSNVSVPEPSNHFEDESPLLLNSALDGAQIANLGTEVDSSVPDMDADFSFPNKQFRFGIIPSGSTDAVVICTTGARDPMTSVLQIVLGKRACLDVAQVVRWKTTSTSNDEPCVRYAASFAGYGFYGDVITESEKYRWMGPTRYDYAGTKVFLKHRSYEAELAYLEVQSEKKDTNSPRGLLGKRIRSFLGLSKDSERLPCIAKCNVCGARELQVQTELTNQMPYSRESKWLTSKGRFLSIGAAVISCRNERAPDGLVADAHLSDGFLHLLLIKDCPRSHYLWHLTQLARKGGNPLNFDFVEHHKTTAFTFTSVGRESTWNIDGELFQAHKLSAQVFRGLISLFATGPEA